MLHVRNLPFDTTEEELVELCAPYGQLVQTKLAVGPNRWRLVMHISLLTRHLSLLHCPGILSSAQQ